MNTVQLASGVIEAMLAEAGEAAPNECCGLLLGEGKEIEQIWPTHNVHPTPQTHFEIDPVALIAAHKVARDGGPQIVGYYHSHPTGEQDPSETDQAMVAHDGKLWAIIADGKVGFFRDGEERFEALSYAVRPR